MKNQSYKKYKGRENILIELSGFERLPKSLDLPGPYFHATIFLDYDDISDDIPIDDPLVDFLDSLLDRGGAYFICGGTAGERIHNYVDDLILFDEIDEKWKYPLQPGKHPFHADDCLLTTWHDDESVEEIVWFALNTARSPDICMKENPANLFLLMQNSPYLGKVKECLEDPSNIPSD